MSHQPTFGTGTTLRWGDVVGHVPTRRPIPERWRPLWSSYALSLESAQTRRGVPAKPKTLIGYHDALSSFGAWFASQGAVPDLTGITREHVQRYLRSFLEIGRHSAASFAFRSLRGFFRWLEDEQEVDRSPFHGLSEPRPPTEYRPQTLDIEAVRQLLAACAGRGFADRRDAAVIRFLYDTGARRGEIAVMKLDDLDLMHGMARVGAQTVGADAGKTGARFVPFGRKTAAALDRYLRSRALHANAGEPWLWLGLRGRLTGDGIYQTIQARAVAAGLAWRSVVHAFRHTFSHAWLAGGGQEGDLMRLTGWKSRAMIDRYASNVADSRAWEAHRTMSPGDDL